MSTETPPRNDPAATGIRARLGARSLVLVGMMGAGKSSIGRRLAEALGLPFVDADAEIERAAGQSISEMFAAHGEPYFRDGERRVIARLLRNASQVVATGGGAVMNAETRALIDEHGISVWLKADLDILMARVRKRGNRPMLKTDDPEGAMRRLIDERYPTYAQSDITVISRDVPHEVIVSEIIAELSENAGVWKKGGMDREPSRMGFDTGSARTVAVELGSRSYDIYIGRGLLSSLGALIARTLPNARVGVVTDANIAGLHLPAVEASLADAGVYAGAVILPPGEASKSMAQLGPLCEQFLHMGLERRDVVLALGGGVIGDLTGFAASITRRGLRFVQVPTTLLAQVDSSVGGKTGINTPQGKNLVGTFHQPSLVVADIDVLATLPPRELRAGYAEVVKYGLLGDRGFFQWCEANAGALLAGDAGLRAEAVAVACTAKAGIVARDETELGERALLNLGHTFGHALEAWAGFSQRLLHGEAVAIGMVLAFGLSEQLGHCPAGTTATVRAHLDRVGLPTRIAQVPAGPDGQRPGLSTLMQLMAQDKKVVGGRQTLILARAIGEAFISRDVAQDTLSAYLGQALSEV